VRSAPSGEIALRVNGEDHRVTLDPRTTLLDALRERLGITGTKKGCDLGHQLGFTQGDRNPSPRGALRQ
jgi:xanthine dehydrogenase YagT iron-sulfur-binding subunit